MCGRYFFTGMTEYHGVAAFQSHHGLAFARGIQQQVVDFVLFSMMSSAPFADIHEFSIEGLEKILIHEVVVEDDIGCLQGFECLDRQQFRVTGTETYQGHRSCFFDRMTCISIE